MESFQIIYCVTLLVTFISSIHHFLLMCVGVDLFSMIVKAYRYTHVPMIIKMNSLIL